MTAIVDLLLTVVLRSDAIVAQEELAERCSIGKVQPVGYLGDAKRSGTQQKGSLHHKKLIHIIHDLP